jgi:hypothetical protein
MGSGIIADNTAFANSQPTDSSIDNHNGKKNLYILPTNDQVDRIEKMNQNDR